LFSKCPRYNGVFNLRECRAVGQSPLSVLDADYRVVAGCKMIDVSKVVEIASSIRGLACRMHGIYCEDDVLFGAGFALFAGILLSAFNRGSGVLRGRFSVRSIWKCITSQVMAVRVQGKTKYSKDKSNVNGCRKDYKPSCSLLLLLWEFMYMK